MNWTDIRAALKTLIGNLAELPGDETQWEDQGRLYVDSVGRAVALLKTDPITPIGQDERITTYDETQALGEEMQDVLRGVRNFTLKVKVESYEQSDDSTAYTYVERVRDRISRASSLAALRDVGCAFIRTEPTADLSAVRDDRWTSIAVLDIRMRVAVSEADPARYGYIATVEVTGPVTP